MVGGKLEVCAVLISRHLKPYKVPSLLAEVTYSRVRTLERGEMLCNEGVDVLVAAVIVVCGEDTEEAPSLTRAHLRWTLRNFERGR